MGSAHRCGTISSELPAASPEYSRVSQYYLIPKKIARAYPALGALAQRLEALIFRGVFWLIGLLSPQQASAAAAALFGLVGQIGRAHV